MVGKLEGDHECVGHRAGAEDGRHDDVADEPCRARQESPGADRQNGSQHVDSSAADILRSYTQEAPPRRALLRDPALRTTKKEGRSVMLRPKSREETPKEGCRTGNRSAPSDKRQFSV